MQKTCYYALYNASGNSRGGEDRLQDAQDTCGVAVKSPLYVTCNVHSQNLDSMVYLNKKDLHNDKPRFHVNIDGRFHKILTIRWAATANQ